MEFLKPYLSLIEHEIIELDLPKNPNSLYEPQRYILNNSGKRIRPILTMLGCGICGDDIRKSIPAAVAVELIHNFTLIHDDIMDQAESRRGKPAVHIKWDLPTAILSGDSMFVQAFIQLQKLNDSTDFKWLNRIFVDGINKVCEGQALDMEFGERFEVQKDQYLEMIKGKTAALTSASLMMGGIVANASVEMVDNLGVIGSSLGLAFQIQDDYLDVFGDAEKFGKKQGGDIYEGKKTFLMVTTLERCNNEEKHWLESTMNRRPLAEDSVNKIVNLYQKYGIADTAKEVMTSYYQKAENTLKSFDDSNYKEDLDRLIKFLKNRDY